MFTLETSRLSRIASAIGLVAFLAISWLANQHNGDRPSPATVAAASGAPAGVTRLPEVVVVAPRLDPVGPRTAH